MKLIQNKPAFTPKDKFWGRVQKTKTCWLWKAGKTGSGYGMVFSRRHGRQVKAHRLSFEIHNGAIPDGMAVCHKCDNRACVRPSHLFLGTQLDNMRDMYSKGRNGYTGHVGEKHSLAIFTEGIVLEIRKLRDLGWKLEQLRSKFGGSKSAIQHITSRYNWKHI